MKELLSYFSPYLIGLIFFFIYAIFGYIQVHFNPKNHSFFKLEVFLLFGEHIENFEITA